VKGDIGKAAEELCVERAALAGAEAPVETAVSAYLRRLPLLWVPIEDEPGPESLRGFIERNVIALASGLHEPIIDPPSPSWLGHHSGRDKVRRSGLCGTSGMWTKITRLGFLTCWKRPSNATPIRSEGYGVDIVLIIVGRGPPDSHFLVSSAVP
jgi:hypothetical protein